MSQLLINDYLKQLDLIKKISGSSRETIVREAFKDLLKAWGKQHGLVFLAEYPLKTVTKTNIAVDGALLHELRMPLGYWEAKDADDDLDAEVSKKFKKGYPQDNIIISDDALAVLWQNRQEVLRCDMTDTAALSRLLKLFFSFERPEIASFRAAVEQFKTDLPAVLDALRDMIAHEHEQNPGFRAAETKFLAHAQEAINPALTDADVREMLIQHILTEEIFAKVFDDSDFHQHNNVARELYALEAEFFTGALKKQTLKGLETYYAAIRAAAAQVSSHSEKQTFLKVIYENFYKVYNAKAADRLGVVYTPNEIVRFMIDGADWLTDKHFGKNLIDRDVDILDPATGTGTFICELLEHFRGQPAKLRHKYLFELHANEVAILPYYVANLNIEATYAAISGSYEEFPSLCFVDTLDNVGLHTAAKGVNADLFGSVSEENVARIKRQNGKRKAARKITKQAIFHYCYAVLHDPVYRDKYAQNLKREFPRIPFYKDFWQWAAWGEALMALHIDYESVAPFALARTDTPDAKARAAGLPPKALLRADVDSGSIALDSETTLRGIPADAWLYKLGNRSALDWVLDQYKEKRPKDPTIREKFDTYRFADYREKVIDLLMRVTTVSVETVRMTQAMQTTAR
jgi:predicted helicase